MVVLYSVVVLYSMVVWGCCPSILFNQALLYVTNPYQGVDFQINRHHNVNILDETQVLEKVTGHTKIVTVCTVQLKQNVALTCTSQL